MIMATANSLHQSNPTTTASTIPASPALNQVLQSESVRRLFNQPNIVIHAIPRTNSPTAFRMVRPNISIDSEKSINHVSHKDDQTSEAKPEVSIRVINSLSEEANEAENLLPSKNNGKSEILLVPVVRKRKECGHFEPCESLICSVNVEEYEDEDGIISPLVSLNINEEEEIDAKVAKHCENNKCDALSIDHDKCRAASVDLHRCDKSSLCDVCGIAFLGDETRMDHKKCRRKHVYQHNTATPTEVFKYRMRQRELQMIEASKSKRSSDYLDPVLGLSRTMEALSKNDELIIIPKMPPFPPKMIVKPCFAPLSSSHNSIFNSSNVMNKSIFNHNNNSMNKNNNLKNAYVHKKLRSDDKHLTSEKISSIIESCKQRIQQEIQQHCSDVEEDSLPANQIQIKLSDHSSLNGATVRIVDIPTREKPLSINLPMTSKISKKEQFMANAGLKLNNVNNVKSAGIPGIPDLEPNDEIKAELRKLNDEGLPEQPYKVVPIVELKSEPSLLHQKKGLPKFCVVPVDPTKTQKSKKMNAVLELKKKRKDENDEVKNIKDEVKKSPKEKKSPSEKESHNEKKIKEDKKENTPKKEENNPEVRSPTSKVLSSPLGKFTGMVKSNKHPAEKLLCNSDNSIDVSTSNFEAKQTTLTKTSKLGRKRIKKPIKRLKYRCTHCFKCFTSLDYCRQHVAQHENKPEFFCRLCDRGFTNKIIMKKHLVTEHTADEVRCEMCNRVLSNRSKLAEHIKCPNSKERQKCPDCNEHFDSCGNLDLHMRKQHGFLICEICKRQISKSKMMRHLMLEHSISKRRAESRFSKLTQIPGENDPIKDFELSKSGSTFENSNSKQVEMTTRTSSRRRSSKDFFMCKVCERRFDSEKQYQIHVANYPMKFTPCLDCGKKFHRKVEYTEHSKTCNPARFNEFNKEEPMRKKKKVNFSNDAVVLKSDKISHNSIDQKRNESLEFNRCKKIKIKKGIIIVQKNNKKEDKGYRKVQENVESEDFEKIAVNNEDNVKEDVEDTSINSKIIETKIVNGLKENSSDNCLDTEDLDVVKSKNFVQIENNDVDKGALLLNDRQSQVDSAKTAAFDKSLATLSSIIQDHNYQVLQ